MRMRHCRVGLNVFGCYDACHIKPNFLSNSVLSLIVFLHMPFVSHSFRHHAWLFVCLVEVHRLF